MAEFIRNIRCKHCECLFRKDSDVSARHYSNYNTYTCLTCGMGDFLEVEEKWVSTAKWYKPHTWGRGFWQLKRN